MGVRNLELLAPAKDLRCGIAAINHGADAVYIGGPRFSARSAASNSLADIEKLVRYAHQFRSRVYVAVNTLFRDDELEGAVKLCHQLAATGADALIIQDVGLLEAELPPIPLHSSTQMNNRAVEKVNFLEKVGFSQVVLARELSLEVIRKIRRSTSVTLEFFVHGALCVSYSGQCYISEVIAGRSANRGECAQFCRHKFDLRDPGGRILQKESYLLSLKDLDLCGHLNDLVDAGIDSFKIEGRLKNENYVKNVTAYYRLALDKILGERSDLAPAASGSCRFGFTPDPEKTFHRGKTDYFLNHPRNSVAEVRSPKSIGKLLGPVLKVAANHFLIKADDVVSNGDGLCYFGAQNDLIGFRVNRVEGKKIYPGREADLQCLQPGTEVFRNFDSRFEKLIKNSDQCRKIAISMELTETENGLRLQLTDEDNIRSESVLKRSKEKSKKPGIKKMISKQLKKSGSTIFQIHHLDIHASGDYFYPAASINQIRRQGFDHHLDVRASAYQVVEKPFAPNSYPWPFGALSYLDNIANGGALRFYLRHGAILPEGSKRHLQVTEIGSPHLMTTKYCVKNQLGMCPVHRGNSDTKKQWPDTLVLADKSGEYQLTFDCRNCAMILQRGVKGGSKR